MIVNQDESALIGFMFARRMAAMPIAIAPLTPSKATAVATAVLECWLFWRVSAKGTWPDRLTSIAPTKDADVQVPSSTRGWRCWLDDGPPQPPMRSTMAGLDWLLMAASVTVMKLQL